MTQSKKFSIIKVIILIVAAVLVFNYVKGIFFTNQQPAEEGQNYFYTYTNSTSNSYTTEWQQESNNTVVINTVAQGAREKRTTIIGNNKDVMTILVYMCGADLESSGAMGSYDLQEMAKAKLSDNINLIVFTGGCKNWHIQGISNKYNQIYKVLGNGEIQPLVENAGSGAMTDPDTLVSFIEYGVKNFKANRYELIFWDHGSGTVGGYGYDERYTSKGSMSLSQIDKALTKANVKFDFIGFDACLMATAENGLMLAEHGDYLIASEESEPGIGWYYTDWLNAVSKNSSMSTVEIGKTIADSFVSTCSRETPSQPATLSVVDLAELEWELPTKLSAFAKSANEMINNNQYKTIATARSGSREFGTNAKVDMVDLADFASNVGTKEAQDLVKTIKNCVKYNNVTKTMSNSYGISIYFPYRSTQYVNTVLKQYDNIEMNEDYSEVVRNFASYQGSGQISSGGSHSAYSSFGGYDTSSYSQQSSGETIYSLLEMFMGGGSDYSDSSSSYSNLYGDLFEMFLGRGNIDKSMTKYIAENHFDADLNWKDGKINLTKKQWSLVSDLTLNMFIDDGTGYIDLGRDNIYDIDKDGNLLAISEHTWLGASVDGNRWQPVAYYYQYETIDGENVISTGRIPALINGKMADIMVVMDDNSIEVVGFTYTYTDETDTVAKNSVGFEEGDVIEFVADYYDYLGNYQATYQIGSMVIGDDKTLKLGDVDISGNTPFALYQFKDIYQQSYWTAPMK